MPRRRFLIAHLTFEKYERALHSERWKNSTTFASRVIQVINAARREGSPRMNGSPWYTATRRSNQLTMSLAEILQRVKPCASTCLMPPVGTRLLASEAQSSASRTGKLSRRGQAKTLKRRHARLRLYLRHISYFRWTDTLMTPPSKSLDRCGGSVFRIKRGAAKVASI